MSRSGYKTIYEGYVDNTTPALPIGYMIESFKTPTKAPAPKIPITLPKVLLPASKVPIRNITPDIINKFLKLV